MQSMVCVLLRILAGWRNQIFSRRSVLCLCKSYSVLTACIASLLQNQAYPVFSRTNPGHAYTRLRPYRLPRQFHPKGTLLCGHRLSQTPLHRGFEFKFKNTSYYSQHYSNSAVTIQIRGTIQNIRYYSNSEYE